MGQAIRTPVIACVLYASVKCVVRRVASLVETVSGVILQHTDHRRCLAFTFLLKSSCENNRLRFTSTLCLFTSLTSNNFTKMYLYSHYCISYFK